MKNYFIHRTCSLPTTIAAVLIIYSSIALYGASQAQIKWKDVNRAGGYVFEVKNKSNKIVLKKIISGAYVNFSLPYGSYRGRITVLNKFKKSAGHSKWFPVIIKKTFRPVILSVTPKKFNLADPPGTITISGEDFLEGVTISLRKWSADYSPDTCKRLSEKEIETTITPSALGTGYFDIIVKNPGELTTVNRNSIQIISENMFSLAAGPFASLPRQKWKNILNNSFSGIKLYAAYDQPVMPDYPVLDKLGVEAELTRTIYSGKSIENVLTSELTTQSAGAGIFYKNNFSLPVNFILRSGTGLCRSTYALTASGSVSTNHSTDFYWYSGLSIRWDLSTFFIESGRHGR